LFGEVSVGHALVIDSGSRSRGGGSASAPFNNRPSGDGIAHLGCSSALRLDQLGGGNDRDGIEILAAGFSVLRDTELVKLRMDVLGNIHLHRFPVGDFAQDEALFLCALVLSNEAAELPPKIIDLPKLAADDGIDDGGGTLQDIGGDRRASDRLGLLGTIRKDHLLEKLLTLEVRLDHPLFQFRNPVRLCRSDRLRYYGGRLIAFLDHAVKDGFVQVIKLVIVCH